MRDEQMGLQLVQRTVRNGEMVQHLSRAATALSLGDVGRHGNRGATRLSGQSIQFVPRAVLRRPIDGLDLARSDPPSAMRPDPDNSARSSVRPSQATDVSGAAFLSPVARCLTKGHHDT